MGLNLNEIPMVEIPRYIFFRKDSKRAVRKHMVYPGIWCGKKLPKAGDIEKTFTAWGPTTIHPSTDMMHQHNLNHLESQLQAAANKAWKAFASEPKVTFCNSNSWVSSSG